MPSLSVICVFVLDGPDAGRSVSVERPTLMVGTGQSAQLRLTDEAVEGEHVELSVHPSGIRLRDLGSSRGTWVGSLCVQEAVLTHSTVVVVGNTTLSVDIERTGVAPESGRPPSEDLAHLPYRAARAIALERFERAYIPSVLAQSGNVVVRAAKRAGVKRGSFHRMLGRVRAASKTG